MGGQEKAKTTLAWRLRVVFSGRLSFLFSGGRWPGAPRPKVLQQATWSGDVSHCCSCGWTLRSCAFCFVRSGHVMK